MFTFILLDGFQKINEERSPAAIYHILTGKRSSQTIQDAHIFHLKNYFGISKTLKKEEFNGHAVILRRKGLIQLSKTSARLTEEGRKFLEQSNARHQVTSFRGLDYDRISELFFDRLTLFIQLAANVLSGQNHFIPISDRPEILNWTKRYFHANKQKLSNLFDELYQELYDFLLTLSEKEASVFVDRLTGFNHFGLSKPQIKDKYELTDQDTELLLLLLTHKLITWIGMEKQKKLVLADFLGVIDRRTLNTESAEKTFALLEKGFNLIEITKIRNLRESTIHDHIVEIAYRHPNFDVSPYMSKEEFEEISRSAELLDSKKLKVLNEALGGKYSYFQLRLVLAVQALR